MENIEVYRTLEERIEQRTAALREAQRQKEEMAALIAHDLKSPANGILLTCKARLRSPSLSEADRRYWRGVEAGADVINRLALNLVDVARSDDGALKPRAAELDTRALVAGVVERMTPLAEAREQTLALDVELGDGRLEADPELLHRVLQNLVDNALRHNRSDVVRLSARDEGERVQLRVVDQGPGVPESMRRQVFDKYTRLDDGDDAQRSVSHGLGLAFCRIAVEAHGGRIWIEQNQPTGAAFVVELPRRLPRAS